MRQATVIRLTRLLLCALLLVLLVQSAVQYRSFALALAGLPGAWLPDLFLVFMWAVQAALACGFALLAWAWSDRILRRLR